MESVFYYVNKFTFFEQEKKIEIWEILLFFSLRWHFFLRPNFINDIFLLPIQFINAKTGSSIASHYYDGCRGNVKGCQFLIWDTINGTTLGFYKINMTHTWFMLSHARHTLHFTLQYIYHTIFFSPFLLFNLTIFFLFLIFFHKWA